MSNLLGGNGGGSGSASIGQAQLLDFTPAQLGSSVLVWLKGSDLANLADGTSVTPSLLPNHGSAGPMQTGGRNAPAKSTGEDGRAFFRCSNGSYQGFGMPSGFSIDRANCSVYIRMRSGTTITNKGGAVMDLGSGLQSMLWQNSTIGEAWQVYNGGAGVNSIQQNPTAGPQLLSYRANGSYTTFRINDQKSIASSVGSAGVSGGAIGGAANSANFDGTYDFEELIIINGDVGEYVDDMMAQYMQIPLSLWNIICDGNSLTAGYNSNDGTNADIRNGYPFQLAQYLGPQYKVQNIGISGQTAEQMSARISGYISGGADTTNYPGRNVVVGWEITNDIATNGQTGVQAYNNYVAYANAVRATGQRFIAVTCLPRGAFGTTSPTMEGYRQTANSLLRQNWTQFADAIVDIDASPLGGVTGFTNGYYYDGDQTHLTRLGYMIVAKWVATAILSIVNQASIPAAQSYGGILTDAANTLVMPPSGRLFVRLPTPTANRALTLPSPANLLYGSEILIWNQSTSGTFAWQFAGLAKDAAGNTITNLVNSSFYRMATADGTNWVKTN